MARKLVVPIQAGTDLTFALNSTVRTNKIPRLGVLQKLTVRLAGILTISAGATSGTLIEDGILRLVRAIRILVGSKRLKVFSGRFLHHVKNTLEMKIAPELTQPGVTVAAHPFAATFEIPFALKDARAGAAFGLPMGKQGYPELILEIDTGVVTDLILGGDRVYAWAATWAVTAEYDRDIRGGISYWTGREIETEYTIPATVSPTTGAEIELPAEFDELRRLGMLVTDNGLRVDTLVTDPVTVELEVGNERGKSSWQMLKQRTRERFQVTPPAGVAVLDFDDDGRMSGLPRLRGYRRPLLKIVHIAGTGVAHMRYAPQEITRSE